MSVLCLLIIVTKTQPAPTLMDHSSALATMDTLGMELFAKVNRHLLTRRINLNEIIHIKRFTMVN